MGHSSKAPAGYQPTGQAAADQSYQNMVASQTPWAANLPQQVIPGLQQTANNVTNNPYYSQALQGSQAAADLGGTVSAGMYGGSRDLSALGGLAKAFTPYAMQGANYAGDAANATMAAGNRAGQAGADIFGQSQSMIPGATAGMQIAPEMLQNMLSVIDPTTRAGLMAANPTLFSGLAKGQQSYDTAMGAIPGLTQGMGAANQVLNTGFDPQQQLYNREAQKQADNTNALNAMYGLSTSAAGAGLAADSSRNFNIDWQNAQLQRQIAALGAYGQESGQVTSNLINLLNTGAGTYEGLTNSAVNNYTGLTSNAANNAANLTRTGVGAFNDLTNSAVGNYTNLANTGFNALNAGANTQIQGVNSGVQDWNALMSGAVGNLGSLTQTAGNAYAGSGALGQASVDTLNQSASLPNATFMQQQQNQIAALMALAQGTGAAMAPGQQIIQDQANYMKIGQSATQNAQNAASINNQAQQAQIGQIAGLAGAAFGAASNPLSLFGAKMWG